MALSSNSIETHPQDGPEFIAKEAEALGEGAWGCAWGWAGRRLGGPVGG